jgi:alpha-L-arabinofuranosidase
MIQRLLASALLLTGFASASPESATITVRVDQPGIRISPLLYGLFHEDWAYAADGGLYPEKIRNRSFLYPDIPKYWSLLRTGEARAFMATDGENTLNPNRERSLRLDVASLGKDGRAGVINNGYDGIALNKDAAYNLTVFARVNPDFTGPLIARIEQPDGSATFEYSLTGVGTDWKKFETTFTSPVTALDFRLVIEAKSPGSIWLGMVSLFPKDTWKNRPNGLRPDLMKLLDETRPKFLRFPGGSLVNTGSPATGGWPWKDTIGPIEQRRANQNVWQDYRRTWGLGFHEYLQMAEDLGAEPVFSVHAGTTHIEAPLMDRMGPWVQSALDALEYANGPITSTWGKLRAENGHPEPFNLRFIGIGNEEGGKEYHERFPLFYDAIKAKYPDVKVITSAGYIRQDFNGRKPDINDIHWYGHFDGAIDFSRKFDNCENRDTAPRVFIGEYAVNDGNGRGNLRAALGEAVILTGLERNSDLVTMVSYAPQMSRLTNKEGREHFLETWSMIKFNNTESYGTPSYQVFKMFARHKGDVFIPTRVEAGTTPRLRGMATTGTIGLGTRYTSAEFKDVVVNAADGSILSSTDFSKGTSQWVAGSRATWNFYAMPGKWSVEDGAYRQTSNEYHAATILGDAYLLAQDGRWSNYTVTLRARVLSGQGKVMIGLRIGADRSGLTWPLDLDKNRWYDLKAEVRGNKVIGILDGKITHDVTLKEPAPHSKLFAGSSLDEKSGELFVKVINISAAPQETSIHLAGSPKPYANATALTLTGNDPLAENTFAEPSKLAPVESVISLPAEGATDLKHIFPPYSVTILKLQHVFR